MRHLEFDLLLVRIVRIIRNLREFKQLPIAIDLDTSISSYSRIEKGETPITPGRLEIIANAIKVTSDELRALTRIAMELTNNNCTLNEALAKIPLMFPQRNELNKIKEPELAFIITRFSLTKNYSQKEFNSLDII